LKYTLFCRKGNSFIPDKHYLFIGRWLGFNPNIVLLQHGVFSLEKLQILRRFDKIALFYDSRYHSLTVEARYNETYYKRKAKEEDLQQFVGYLYKKTDNLYEGSFTNGL